MSLTNDSNYQNNLKAQQNEVHLYLSNAPQNTAWDYEKHIIFL